MRVTLMSEAEAGKFDVQRGRGFRRQPLFGLPAVVTQAGEITDRGGGCRVGVRAAGDIGEHLGQ